eukprot:gene7402-8222_t
MAEKKFTSLRKRLDQLGYRQPLGLESVPLVEKLFSDLVHTTESLKNVKLQHSRLGRDSRNRSDQDSIEPYKSDNSKLVRENNDLHLQLIRQKEESDAKIKGTKEKLRKLEQENSDLKFLNSQYVHKVRTLEKDLKARTERILELQEKNLHAVVETPGGKKKQIPYRRQRMDIDNLLPPSETTSSSVTTSDDPYVADLLGVADEKIHSLQIDVTNFREEKEAAERRNKSLHKQLEARDKEIERLNHQLEGGRPLSAINRDNKRESGDRVIAHLNVQVDYLQQANRDLEQQIKHALDSQHAATSTAKELQEKNDELCGELRKLDKTVKKMESNHEAETSTLRRQMREIQDELGGKHQSVIDMQAELHRVKKERESMIDESERLTNTLANAQEDIGKISALLEKTDKEKRRLQEKNAKLTITERELVMELERLKLSKTGSRKSAKSPDRVELLMRNLEDERDHYRDECEILQEMIKKRITTSKHSTSRSPSRKDGKQNAHLEGMLELMQEERDFYKREYELTRNLKQKYGDPRSPPTKDKPSDTSSEANRLRRERDELQSMLEKFERHLTGIQNNVRNLTTEKENIQLLYEQATDEIQRLRRQLSRAKSPSPTRKVTSILERVEKERDDAVDDLRRMKGELQALENQFSAMQDGQSKERSKHDERISDLEQVIDKLERERSELHTRVTSLREMLTSLEEQLKSTTSSLRNSRETVADREAEISKMRLLLEQSERSVDDLKRRLEKTMNELQRTESDKLSLEDCRADMEHEVQTLRDEMHRLKGMASSLDRERDLLQQEVDHKTEQLVDAEKTKTRLERAENELKINVEELEERLRYKEHDASSQVREIKSLSKQTRSLEDELAAVSMNRDSVINENKRLQSDLATMTEENQRVNQHLQDALDDQDMLKAQVAEYSNQVARIEDLLAIKDQEKNDLLLQYQTLSNRTELLENNVQQTSGEANAYRKEILQKEQDVNHYSDRCKRLEDEVEQYIAAQDAYEQQLSSMAKSLSNMEEQLRQANQEKEILQQDLTAVRDLCVKLDHARESLTKQLAVRSEDESELQNVLSDARTETDTLRRQFLQERDNVKSLENIISSNREKQFYEQKTHEDTVSELERVQSSLSKAERERDMKDSEVKSLRKTADKVREELEHLRKQLTSEKYERERQAQELRRKAISPMTTTLASDLKSKSFHKDKSTNSDYLSSIRNYTSPTTNRSMSPPPSPVRPVTSDILSPIRGRIQDYSSDVTSDSGR